jgi:IS5 family transposase
MERELFALFLKCVEAMAGARRRPPRCQYSDRDIVVTLLWAVLHDRPMDWACRRRHWPRHDRTRPLPSGSTMCRRLRSASVLDLLLRVIASLNPLDECNDKNELILDAKALAVAHHSADPDARFGRGVGALAKGYKLHLIADSSGKIVAFAVRPLNVSEQHVAGHLLQSLPGDSPRRLLADGNYDCNRLYDLATEKNLQLIAARRYKNARGIGHRKHSPHRLEALRLMQADPTILAPRRRIEGTFGTLGNVIGGLTPLPNHVRRLPRVERWLIAKLIIYSLHRKRRKQNQQTAA